MLKLPEKGVYSASTTVSLAMKLYISDSEPILLDQIRCYKLSCLVCCIVEHPCPSCNSISTCEAPFVQVETEFSLVCEAPFVQVVTEFGLVCGAPLSKLRTEFDTQSPLTKATCSATSNPAKVSGRFLLANR